MRRGPKPKATRLKILAGNPGKRKLNLHEPKPPATLPRCPQFLDVGAKREWRRIVPILAEMKVLTQADGVALAMYCSAHSRWVDASNRLQEFGAVLLVGKAKYPTVSPYFSIATTSFKQMQSLLGEFGLTPSSRSRLQVLDKTESAEDPLEALKARVRAIRKSG